MNPYDLVIIGTGPAGLAAGIQARHVGLKVLLVEKDQLGGRLLSARRVENFPLVGRFRKETGPYISHAILAQAIRKGVKVEQGDCRGVDFGREIFKLILKHTTIFAKTVILATGVRPKEVKILRDGDTWRLAYDWRALPTKLSGKSIYVLGGGEVAFDQACSLAERKARVTMLIRRRFPKGFPELVQEAKALGVRVLTEAKVTGCISQPHGLRISLIHRGRKQEIWLDYCLVSIGAVPQRPNLTKEAGKRIGRGLYWAGDVCNSRYRQAAIAFGDGVKKAMMAYDYLRSQKVRAEI